MVVILGTEAVHQPKNFGQVCLLFTDNVPLLTRIFDFWVSYEKVIPSKRHRAVGKETGQTNHVERSNNTFRQRISRLVRKSLSFSKNVENHIGAIWYFIHDYNAQLGLAEKVHKTNLDATGREKW